MINLLELGKKQNTSVVTTCNTIEAVDAVVNTQNVKTYELAMDTFKKAAIDNTVITNEAILNNYTLTNYTYTLKNDRLYIIDKGDNNIVYGSLALGNVKLKATNKEIYLQFNIGQKICCPLQGITCKNCYADNFTTKLLTASQEISNVGISRIKNTVLTQFSNFTEIMNGAIKYMQKMTNKRITFRWHESGDIYSKLYFKKIKEIMFANKDIQFMIYTRVPFVLKEINELNQEKNIKIRYSVDKSTSKGIFNYILENDISTFIAMDYKDTDFKEALSAFYDKGIFCNVKNPEATKKRDLLYSSKELHCLKCGKCTSKKINHLYVVIH